VGCVRLTFILFEERETLPWFHWMGLLECSNQCMHYLNCRNLSFGLATKARGCKVASQEGSLGVMPHAPGSAKECEGIDPHTPKGTPTLAVGVMVDSQRAMVGVKTQWIEDFFISLEIY
jgi:hypothetical protein